MRDNSRAFTLIEVLATVAIIALLAGLVLPALSRSRQSANTLVCATHLREMAKGWQTYADDNRGTLMPLRIPAALDEGNPDPRADLRAVGNGLKILPRWPVLIGAEIGIPAFEDPSETDERQNYDDPFYQCPAVPNWVDERNYAYGYNYQFLGNSLVHYSRRKEAYNYPVKQVQITSPSGTILFGDSMGTTAGMTIRLGYNDNGDHLNESGNLAYRLDPPRFNTLPFMGVGGPGASGPTGSLRTGVDPRHRGKCNVAFGDSHTETKTPRQLGYVIRPNGVYADENLNESLDGNSGLGKVGLRANNRLFSGTGRDSDAILLIHDR